MTPRSQPTVLFRNTRVIDLHIHPFLTDMNLMRLEETPVSLVTALARHAANAGYSQAMLDKLKKVREFGLRSLEVCKTAGVKMGFGTDILMKSVCWRDMANTIWRS